MDAKSEFYEAFAGLIFSIANADGVVDDEEVELLKERSGDHPISSFIEAYLKADDDEISIISQYKKVKDIYKERGPFEDAVKCLNILKDLSAVSKAGEEEDDDLFMDIVEDLSFYFK